MTTATPLTPLPTPDAGDLAHLAKYSPGVRVRALVEREIMRRTIAALLDQGYLLQINDGEDDATEVISDAAVLLEAAFSTDEDRLRVYKPGRTPRYHGWIHFIYGNSGWDVISDHTTNLTEELKPLSDYADQMEAWF